MRGEIAREAEPWGAAAGDPGLCGTAYIGLAKQGDASIRDEVTSLLGKVPGGPDRAALEVSLALLGIPGYIKAGHFRFQSNVLGSAAIRAIETFWGPRGFGCSNRGWASAPAWGDRRRGRPCPPAHYGNRRCQIPIRIGFSITTMISGVGGATRRRICRKTPRRKEMICVNDLQLVLHVTTGRQQWHPSPPLAHGVVSCLGPCRDRSSADWDWALA